MSNYLHTAYMSHSTMLSFLLFSAITINLRSNSGITITLPDSQVSKEELAVEADYYGLVGLVKDIRMPKVDISDFVPKETLGQWQAEAQLRTSFVDGSAKGYSDMFRGLVPLFPISGREDQSPPSLPLKFNPDCEIRREKKGFLFMHKIRTSTPVQDPEHQPAVTVKSLVEFETNFNKEWPNVLNRLRDVLLEDPVIVAGGSVLRALTASKGTRTADWWSAWSVADRGTCDIDLFLYGCNREEANRISNRIFHALAQAAERWCVVRGNGVINIHHYNDAIRQMETKVQIVLRIYDTPTEVLVGFDIDCCCCAFDGRDVWVCPRWVSALQSGVNVLNPLHAWPNKASYEYRLAKYAFRGFAVLVPGLDSNKIDLERIVVSDIKDLHGLSRFLKVSLEMDSATPYKTLEYAEEGDEGAVQDNADPDYFWIHHSRPRTPRDIPSLRSQELLTVTEDMRLIEHLNTGYDDPRSSLVIPRMFQNPSFLYPTLAIYHSHFPVSPESRIRAWADIVDAGENHPKSVDRRLIDAWDTSKRSREYLNGQMDKFDLDYLYYSKAYYDDEVGDEEK